MYYTPSIQRHNNSVTSAIIISLIYPLAGLFLSLYQWRQSWAKNVFWMACMFMGAVHIFHPAGAMLGEGADGGRYVLALIKMHYLDTTIENIVASLFSDGVTMDLYQPIVTFLVSRFTSNGHVLFFVFAFVFGFFYSRNIWYVLEKLQGKLGNWTWVLVAYYFLICPIWYINGVRMWTALHVFVYGAMPFIFEKDKSKLIWCFMSLFVHFSFLYPIAILILYTFMPKRKLIPFLVFYLITLSFKTIDLTFVQKFFLTYLPGIYEKRINGYTNEDVALARAEQEALASWHVVLAEEIVYWIVQIYILLSYYSIKRYLNNDESIKRLYTFSLLIYGISNIFAMVPSGGRFIIVSQMFMIPLFLFVITKVPKTALIRKLQTLLMLLILFSVVFNIRKAFDYYGISLLSGNYLTILFFDDNIPLINFVKQIL